MARPKIDTAECSHIGILLDHERYAQRISYAELARRAGKGNRANSHGALRRFGDMSVSTAVAYAKALNCKILLEYPNGRTLEVQGCAFKPSDYSSSLEYDPTDPLA